MADQHVPFYSPVNRRSLFMQNEIVETTKPGDQWATYAPTGRRRAYFWGIRIPFRLAYLMLPAWMQVLSWKRMRWAK